MKQKFIYIIMTVVVLLITDGCRSVEQSEDDQKPWNEPASWENGGFGR